MHEAVIADYKGREEKMRTVLGETLVCWVGSSRGWKVDLGLIVQELNAENTIAGNSDFRNQTHIPKPLKWESALTDSEDLSSYIIKRHEPDLYQWRWNRRVGYQCIISKAGTMAQATS